jgi:hypothetical protein
MNYSTKLLSLSETELDELINDVEAQKPFDNLSYKIFRFFAHNLLFIWVLLILPYMDIASLLNYCIYAVAFLASNLIAYNNGVEKLTIRQIINRYIEIGDEDFALAKKKRMRYWLSMFNWSCLLYLPFIALIVMERSELIIVEVSKWLQFLVAISWIIAFMAFSDKHLPKQSLNWDLRSHNDNHYKVMEKLEKNKNSKKEALWIFFGLLIFYIVMLWVVIISFGLFGEKAKGFDFGHDRKAYLQVIICFITPFLSAWSSSVIIGKNAGNISFFLKRHLDKLN